MNTTWLVNSAFMPAGAFGRYEYRPATWSDVAAVLRGERGEWRSTIGYAETAAAIRAATGLDCPVVRDSTALRPGDRMLVVRLRERVHDPRSKGRTGATDPEFYEVAEVVYVG
ncbi:MAG: YddF family protein [Burkholderiaceae bacterium]|nr:YddF family protein [Burkholderiaceae bacterium]